MNFYATNTYKSIKRRSKEIELKNYILKKVENYGYTMNNGSYAIMNSFAKNREDICVWFNFTTYCDMDCKFVIIPNIYKNKIDNIYDNNILYGFHIEGCDYVYNYFKKLI